jgi:hypothetical protein
MSTGRWRYHKQDFPHALWWFGHHQNRQWLGICVQPSIPRVCEIAAWHPKCPYSKGNTNNSWILFVNNVSNMTLVVWRLGRRWQEKTTQLVILLPRWSVWWHPGHWRLLYNGIIVGVHYKKLSWCNLKSAYIEEGVGTGKNIIWRVHPPHLDPCWQCHARICLGIYSFQEVVWTDLRVKEISLDAIFDSEQI